MKSGRQSIIDIGSNSIRLVVFERIDRTFLTIFNEKVLCGLARGLDRTGRLDPGAAEMALVNLGRFAALSEAMGAAEPQVIATSAVRDAEDGLAFVDRVAARTGLRIRIISGREEAHLAGKGVLSGMPAAVGIVGDLGGGSLELAAIGEGRVQESATLPIGPLRLGGAAADLDTARATVRHAISRVGWLRQQRGRTVYPVGGAWRSLAKAHMAHSEYPLKIIQHFTVARADLKATASVLAQQSPAGLANLAGVSRRRLESMPLAAMILEEVVDAIAPSWVVFSSHGVREGYAFERLDPATSARDPLMAGCEAVAVQIGRFGDSDAVGSWIRPVFRNEPARHGRLIRAAALLSDLCWADNPDYRALHGFTRVLVMTLGGLDHADRLKIALAIFVRYGGELEDPVVTPYRSLMDTTDVEFARRLGLALRLGHTVTGGAPKVLAETELRYGNGRIEIILTAATAALAGDVLRRRLDQVAKAMGLKGRISMPAVEDVQGRPQG